MLHVHHIALAGVGLPVGDLSRLPEGVCVPRSESRNDYCGAFPALEQDRIGTQDVVLGRSDAGDASRDHIAGTLVELLGTAQVHGRRLQWAGACSMIRLRPI